LITERLHFDGIRTSRGNASNATSPHVVTGAAP
jgi:hypothetical protein